MEDFVTYDLAVKLKEKGFPQHICDDAYITENEYDDDKYLVGERWGIPFIPDYCNVVAAPTISQVLKWLREEKGLHIEIRFDNRGFGACIDEYDIHTLEHISFNPLLYYGFQKSYEDAAISGIEYVIDKLM